LLLGTPQLWLANSYESTEIGAECAIEGYPYATNSMGCFSGVMASARNVAEAALNYEDTIGCISQELQYIQGLAYAN
jgi:hypothetical protein